MDDTTNQAAMPTDPTPTTTPDPTPTTPTDPAMPPVDQPPPPAGPTMPTPTDQPADDQAATDLSDVKLPGEATA